MGNIGGVTFVYNDLFNWPSYTWNGLTDQGSLPAPKWDDPPSGLLNDENTKVQFRVMWLVDEITLVELWWKKGDNDGIIMEEYVLAK